MAREPAGTQRRRKGKREGRRSSSTLVRRADTAAGPSSGRLPSGGLPELARLVNWWVGIGADYLHAAWYGGAPLRSPAERADLEKAGRRASAHAGRLLRRLHRLEAALA